MNFPDPMLPPIVIVDDSEDDIFLLRHRLREGGVTNPIRAFTTVEQALNYLRVPPADDRRPRLVFTDIRMAGGGGHELMRRIREDPAWDTTMLVVVTSSNDASDMKQAIEAGANAYLLKFPPADLLAEFVHCGPWFSVRTQVEPTAQEPAHAHA